VAGCAPIPAGWQRPAGIFAVLIGLAAIVFSPAIAARGRSSRPVNIIVGAAFIVIGALSLVGVIQFGQHCSPA